MRGSVRRPTWAAYAGLVISSYPRIRDFLSPSYRREVSHSPVLLRVSSPAWSDAGGGGGLFFKNESCLETQLLSPHAGGAGDWPSLNPSHRTSWGLHAETVAHIHSGVFIYDAINMG